jgi:hypothetical protein
MRDRSRLALALPRHVRHVANPAGWIIVWIGGWPVRIGRPGAPAGLRSVLSHSMHEHQQRPGVPHFPNQICMWPRFGQGRFAIASPFCVLL